MKLNKLVENFIEGIKNGKESTLREIIDGFLTNKETTIALARALERIARSVATREENLSRKMRKEMTNLYSKLRKKVNSTPPEKILEILERLSQHPENEQFSHQLLQIIFGAHMGDRDQTLAAFRLFVKSYLLAVMKTKSDEITEIRQGGNLMKFLLVYLSNLGISLSWLNLLEMAKNGEKEAEELISRLFSFIILSSDKPVKFNFYSHHPEIKITPSGVIKMRLSTEKIIDEKEEEMTFSLYVPQKFLSVVKEICEKCIEKIKKENEAVKVMVEWVKNNLSLLETKFAKMWEEIQKPRYGLRPDGKDLILLKIDGLPYYQSIQFYPLPQWPIVRVKVNLLIENEAGSFSFSLFPNELRIKNRNYTSDDPREFIDKLLVYLAVECYWRIVTGEIYKGRKTSEKTGSSGEEKDVKNAKIEVRAHFRRLPEGWQASQKALSLAQQTLGNIPPPGMTFVSKYTKNAGKDEKETPLFTYTKKDLLSVEGYNL